MPYATDIDDASQNSVVQIKNGQKVVDTYVWQHDDKPLPSNEELVIYELFVGGFTGGENDNQECGKFQDVIEKLDYLSQLGINAIELMPIQEYPGDNNWGYTPRHFFAVESSYGSSTDLKRLIDECHGRGIRVLIDCIFNHSDFEAPANNKVMKVQLASLITLLLTTINIFWQNWAIAISLQKKLLKELNWVQFYL